MAEPQIAEHSCLSVQPKRLHERTKLSRWTGLQMDRGMAYKIQ